MSFLHSKANDGIKRITTVQLGGVQRFVLADCLKEANVVFLPGELESLPLRIVEENVPDAELEVYYLEESKGNNMIISQICNPKCVFAMVVSTWHPEVINKLGHKVKISLAHLFCLPKKQSRGQDGVLNTDFGGNICYVNGRGDDLSVIHASWIAGGHNWWQLSAGAFPSYQYEYGWNEGTYVLSNAVKTSTP